MPPVFLLLFFNILLWLSHLFLVANNNGYTTMIHEESEETEGASLAIFFEHVFYFFISLFSSC